MPFITFQKILFFGLMCIFPIASSSLHAQFLGVADRERAQWVDENLLCRSLGTEEGFDLIDSSWRIVGHIPALKPSLGSAQGAPFKVGDAYYASTSFETTTSEGTFNRTELFRLINGRWSIEAWIQLPSGKGIVRHILPTTKEHFIIVTDHPRLLADSGHSPFWLGKKNEKGSIELIRSLDCGLKQNYWSLNGNSLSYQIAFGKNTCVVVEGRPGRIWLLDLENEKVSSPMMFFDALDEARLQRNDFATVVVHFQPKVDGDFLFSVREEKGVLDANYREFEKMSDAVIENSSENDPHAGTRWLELQNASIRSHPMIEWFLLNGREGKLQKMEVPPQGAKLYLDSVIDLIGFNWIPKWDGSVSFNSIKDEVKLYLTYQNKGKVKSSKILESPKKKIRKSEAQK